MGGGVSTVPAPDYLAIGENGLVPPTLFPEDDQFRLSAAEARPTKRAQLGPAAHKAKNVIQLLQEAVKMNGGRDVMKVERPEPAVGADGVVPPSLPDSQWKTWTLAQMYSECQQIAKACLVYGLARKDCVSIFGFNSPEWFMSLFSGLMAGAVTSGIYPTDTPEQIQYKLSHSNTSVFFVEGKKQLELVKTLANDVPYLKAIVVWKEGEIEAHPPICRDDGTEIKVVNWQEALESGKGGDLDGKLIEIADTTDPDTCCLLVYTSGTTGMPKAVMLSHDNIFFQLQAVLISCGPIMSKPNFQHRILSYLPLSHVAGLFIDIITPVLSPVIADSGVYFTVYFARTYDLKKSSIVARLQSCRPTIFLGVPRVWEKISEKLKAIGAKVKGLKKKVATFAKKQGYNYMKEQNYGASGMKPPFKYRMVDKVVLSKIKKKLGLDCMLFGLTGAAPIKQETLEYFGSLGIQINEVYGMSESTGVTSWSSNEHHLWGTVGWELPGTEVKTFRIHDDGSKTECPRAENVFKPTPEEEGELCYRGRHIMLGYLANPIFGEEHMEEIKKKNREALDSEGWLHSGDKGCVDKDGLIRITGRYKELIIGAGGENIAPVPIEDACIKNGGGLIANFMMIGDKRKFNIALVTLAAVGATGEFPGGDELESVAVQAIGDGTTKVSEARKNSKAIQMITEAITKTNSDGEVVTTNAAKIQKFTILPRDFSITTGELTATMKTKRSVIEKMHADMIEKIYESSDIYVEYVE